MSTLNKNNKRAAPSSTGEELSPSGKRAKSDAPEEGVDVDAESSSAIAAAPIDKAAKGKGGGKKKVEVEPSVHQGPAFTAPTLHLPAEPSAFLESLPDRTELEAKTHFKILSWNANGLRAALKKPELLAWLKKERPDLLAVQETKIDASLHASLEKCFAEAGLTHCHFTSTTTQKGYAGVCMFSREKPLSVTSGLGIAAHDGEGRVTAAEYDGFIIVNVYTPNSGVKELERLEYRTKEWDPAFRAYLTSLRSSKGGKPLIVVGDLNVGYHDMDVHDPKGLRNKCAGFCDGERDGFAALLKDVGLSDVWRERNPTQQQFSFFSPRFGCRGKGKGWRLDYCLVDASLTAAVEDVFVRATFPWGDHLPIGLTLKL